MARKRYATTEAVQARILDAALQVFTEKGYAEATMNDIIATSRTSVGSIYHHFPGGKKELFEGLAGRLRRIALEYVASKPDQSFERTFLEVVWDCRDVARLLTSAETPLGYSATERVLDFYAREHKLLPDDGGAMAPALAGMLIEVSRHLANLECATEAKRTIDAADRWCQVIKTVGY